MESLSLFYFCYLRQGGYVFIPVCWFVYLYVEKTTNKTLNRFPWNFVEAKNMDQERNHYILGSVLCALVYFCFIIFNHIFKTQFFFLWCPHTNLYVTFCVLSIFHLPKTCFVRHRLNRPAHVIVLCISIIHSILSLRGREFLYCNISLCPSSHYTAVYTHTKTSAWWCAASICPVCINLTAVLKIWNLDHCFDFCYLRKGGYVFIHVCWFVYLYVYIWKLYIDIICGHFTQPSYISIIYLIS